MQCELTIDDTKVVVSKYGSKLQTMLLKDIDRVYDYMASEGRIILKAKANLPSLFICINKKSLYVRDSIKKTLQEVNPSIAYDKIGYKEFLDVTRDLTYPIDLEEELSVPTNQEEETIIALQKQLADLAVLSKGMDRMLLALTPKEPVQQTWSVLHEDGDFDEAVPRHCIRLAENRDPDWGKDSKRGFDLLPPDADEPGVGLYIGAPVVARWMRYHNDEKIRGTRRDAWFAGTIVSLPKRYGRQYLRQTPKPKTADSFPPVDDIKWCVLHEDGDLDENVPNSRIRLCPRRPEDWGKGNKRGKDILPPSCGLPGDGLYIGAQVVAQYSKYKGTADDAWFAASIIEPRNLRRSAAKPFNDTSAAVS
eukprot:TRINITY_DN1204_c1_g1_i1.p1 TRINITY_DN1204_c1_g1~~TRINITY_DN1204_c1_g1_i1.p1  ORF type:complete len:405 (+),score=66.68 TRINITY_DN1204_c1_g1_i1:126-1217(+)